MHPTRRERRGIYGQAPPNQRLGSAPDPAGDALDDIALDAEIAMRRHRFARIRLALMAFDVDQILAWRAAQRCEDLRREARAGDRAGVALVRDDERRHRDRAEIAVEHRLTGTALPCYR